jgi:hypothetical protein
VDVHIDPSRQINLLETSGLSDAFEANYSRARDSFVIEEEGNEELFDGDGTEFGES